MEETKIICKTAMIDCLIDNNRFNNRRINAEQIGAKDFRTWTNLMADLHKVAYKVYEATENHTDTEAPRSDLFKHVKLILSVIGDLELVDKDGNTHKAPVTIDDKFANDIADLCANYAGKIGKDKAPELQYNESKLANARTMLKKYQALNGVNPDAIKALEDEIAELEEEHDDLMNTPDMCKGKPTVASPGTFRQKFEAHLARTIEGQKAKSWEEYQEEKAAKKKKSNKKANERKRAKRAEEAKAKAGETTKVA